MTPPVVLTIAGSDPVGGAGLQADLRTFAALGVHGASALTAVTAQTTSEVRDFWLVTPDQLAAQLDAILGDLPVASVKTGLLANAELVDVVGGFAEDGRLPNLVVDPVLVNRLGQPFLREPELLDGLLASYRPLFGAAVLATPNKHEAELIAPSIDGLAAAPLVVVTNEGLDQLSDGRKLVADRIDTTNTRGTGDSFSAAVASFLAHGQSIDDSLAAAKTWITTAIRGAADWDLGAGPGPIDQMHWGTSS